MDTNGHRSELNAKQAAALAALLSEPTVKDAARVARVHASTLWRYLAEPTFAAAYSAGRRELVSHTIMRLQAKAADAVQVLADIADDKDAPASARVTAARAIIDSAIKGAELADLQAEVAEIKRMLAERERGDG